jgi:iron complex outermembrane receptor protein
MQADRCARWAGRALRAARTTALAALSGAAGAQGAQPGVSLRVDVTGSNIPRSDVESSLPLQVITRDEIARTGVTTTAELMARVSANVLGFNDALSIGAPFNAGLASISLRGLGDGSTLVLLNGRRVSNYAMSGAAVDVNEIPLAAIDRVEILKDGASAIYGSDAIAGVVNFILRKDFTGFELTAFGSGPQRSGGEQWQGLASAGHGDLARDGYNVFVMVGYQKDEALDALERSFSRTGYRPDEGLLALPPMTFPANVVLARGLAGNPSFAAGCAPPASLPTTAAQTAGNMCGYDVARETMLLPEVERKAAYARGTLRIGGMHELFAELGYTDNRLTAATSPTPVIPTATPGGSLFFYPENGPFYPTAFAEANGVSGDLGIVFRTVALGRRVTETKSTAWRSVVGAQGTLSTWDYATALTYSHNDQRNAFRSGWVYTSRLQEALATGLVNPFGASAPEGDALLAATRFIGEANRADGTTIAFDARASTEVTKLAGGPLAVAVGVEARRERLKFDFADPFLAGDILGINLLTHSIAGDRSVQALFGELDVPFARGVEAQVALRYDHYSDFGGTLNPKVALRWQPVRSLLLRTSWGTGFRPPTLYDLNEPRLQSILFGNEDPLRCPVTEALGDCEFLPAVFGGNPALQPEKSSQFNAGVVWEPLSSVSLALDYWTIGKRNLIGQLPDYLIFENYERFAPTNVVRGPVDPAFPDLPGPIENVVLTWQNLGKVRTSGVDVDVQWKPPATRIGTFAFAFSGTYMLEWKWQPDALGYERAVGRNVLGPLPRWRHALSLDWSRGAWGATLVQTFQSGYEDVNSFPPRLRPPPAPRRVSSYELYDLQFRYTGFRNWSIAAGIRNLFDRDPPFTNQPFTAQVGYDPTYADPRGRSYYARLGYAFR